jgi:hypothetical protein
MRVQTLPIPGEAGGVTLYAHVNHLGQSLMVTDREGSGWLGTVSATITGQRGGALAYLSLHPGQARDLARKLERTADFAEARAKGEAGPCLCTAWSHNVTPCANNAALDYTMCRECWAPVVGQQGLTMGHGA